MNPGQRRPVPARASASVVLLMLGLSGCLGTPDIDSGEPVVITETGRRSLEDQRSPEQAAAIAEMRQQAERGDALPYPDAAQGGQTSRLAARPEPLTVAQVEAIEAELADVVRRQSSAVSPAELAALRAREAELRRLAARTQAAGAAARRNPAAPVLGR